jgi:transposase InsO family protein
MEQALKRIYHDPSDPGSLGGVDRLLRRAKELKVPNVDREAVTGFLRKEQAYTLHKPARRHFPRNRTYVSGIDAQWQADLADMQGLARQNGGMRYILTVIDVFSKFAWVAPVKSKDAPTIVEAFRAVLERAAPRKPRRLQTDKGKEFFNKDFATLMRQQDIHHFASESDQKAAVVERFNRTIKTRLWTYMSDRGTVLWTDVIQNMVKAYNQSRHRAIGMAPVAVQKKDELRLWTKLYGDGDTELKRERIAPGSMARISKAKGLFEKGYMPNWSQEHFTVNPTPPGPPRKGTKRGVYKLTDYNGEPIRGVWYPEEVQSISDNQYRIEKVLRRKTAPDGTKELYVKWEGWPEKFNSWIKETDQYDVTGA